MQRGSAFGTLLCLLLASAAWAQPASGTVFLSGAAFAAIEKVPTSAGLGVTDEDAGGTVAGGGLGVGVHLTPHVSARFEWSRTGTLVNSQRLDVLPLTRGTPFGGTGSSVGLPFPGAGFVAPTYESSRTTDAGFVLLGYHLPAGRASVEVVGGVGFVHQAVTTSYDVRILAGLGLPIPPLEFTASSHDAVAVVGADVAVTLGGHVAIVPHIRTYARDGRLSLRPALALRWTF